jgi:hypothetical protein
LGTGSIGLGGKIALVLALMLLLVG